MASRPIASVDVKLADTVAIKTRGNVSTKDVYSYILSNKEFYTSDISEYTAFLNAVTSDKDKSANKVSPHPKFFVSPNANGTPSCILLGNALICTPQAPNFDAFPASLNNHDQKLTGQMTYMDVRQNPGWIDGVVNFGYYSLPRRGNLLGSSGGTDVQNSPEGGLGGSETHINNTWFSIKDGGKNVGSFYETLQGIAKAAQDATNELLISDFALGINQPFSLKFALFRAAPDITFDTDKSPSDTKTDPVKDQEYLQVSWGNFKAQLVIYQDKKIEFWWDGKQISTTQLPVTATDAGTGWTQITIYPLGNYIYIFGGLPSTEASIKKQYVLIDTKEPVKIESGSISIQFHCGSALFNFSPIVHPNAGTITSPLIGNGGQVDNHVFHIGYLGKFGVGSRALPITFPDSGDKGKFYDYYKKYTIDLSYNSEGNSSYTYDLTLNVPNPAEDINSKLQQAHKGISQAVASAVSSFAAGQSTVSQMNNTVNAAVESYNDTFASVSSSNFFGSTNSAVFINGVKASYNQFFQDAANAFGGFFGVSTNADGTVATSQSSTVQDAANRIFGGGGTLDTTAKAIRQTAQIHAIRSAQPNIYSAAVYWVQLTLIRNLESIGLSPNPQIDNCDVMEVEISQAVEGSKGHVTLNNRAPCESSSGGSKGKYTYDGSNNFCGIKPITVRLGTYNGGGNNNTIGSPTSFGFSAGDSLNTVFTGYVTNRKYSRNSNGESICTIELEDISKKLKESYAVNLPFFDGWCSLAVIYYLCKEAGFADDEILLYEDPNGGSKVTIRSLLTGDPDTFQGGCFDGHCNDTPNGGPTSLPGSYLHMTLPYAQMGFENPAYAFAMGTKLWECCQRVREFSNFYLYANNFGHIVYCPPAKALKSVDKKFVEVDTLGNFNEIRRRLDVSLDTAESRNAVFVTGIKFFRHSDVPGQEGSWGPHAHTAVAKGYPRNTSDTCFAPWLRYVFLRNPKWESEPLAALACQEILRRATRQRVISDFSSWGDSSLFPYHVITIDESISNETSANNFNPYVIASHTISASSSDFSLNSSFSVESVDFAAANYEPNLANIRE